MTDCFALLDEPRRPWLDPDLLKRKFLALSATAHPDRAHSAGPEEKHAAQEHFAELTVAYNCLKEPKERLKHFLELELGRKPRELHNIPKELSGFFMDVGTACTEADKLLAEKGAASSHLMRAQLFERSQEKAELLATLLGRLNSWADGLLSELKKIDTAWDCSREASGKAEQLDQLEELWRLFGYLSRWTSQLREKIAQLSF
jgi:curved DNA-binding protein CbpA